MSVIDIDFEAGGISLEPLSGNWIRVEAKEADVKQILNSFDLTMIVEHYGASDLLEEIGEAQAKEHFEIE
ncbi:hypothetical protein WG219_11320 [Ectopseudomonas mendocina]|uniref:Uncharacterized protein n=1 Tax=Ectopseudomonas mendocina TaxID=300 RepID=A0ABZ2REG7_ECTME